MWNKGFSDFVIFDKIFESGAGTHTGTQGKGEEKIGKTVSRILSTGIRMPASSHSSRDLVTKILVRPI